MFMYESIYICIYIYIQIYKYIYIYIYIQLKICRPESLCSSLYTVFKCRPQKIRF